MSVQIHREAAGLMLSLSDMRKVLFHLMQPVVHDELFDFALKLAREANLDARAISEEDTLVFFKRIVAKLHGVSMTKEFINPKKKQENTVKAITSGETTPTKGAGKSKGKAPALPKGTKGEGKGKKGESSQTLPPSSTQNLLVREVRARRGMEKQNLPSLRENQANLNQRQAHLQGICYININALCNPSTETNVEQTRENCSTVCILRLTRWMPKGR